MIRSELELGVLGIDADALIYGSQFFNTVLGCNSTASLGQQVLAGESTSRLDVVPGPVQLALLYLDTTDNQAQQAVDRILGTQST